jgi:Bacterial dnaA protein helix-turn-helix
MMPPRTRAISFVIETVAADFGMTMEDIVGPCRDEPVTSVRQLAVRLARDLAEPEGYSSNSLPSYLRLARVFQRDHSTIMHAYARAGQRLRVNSWLRARHRRLEREIRAVLNPQIVEPTSCNGSEMSAKEGGDRTSQSDLLTLAEATANE